MKIKVERFGPVFSPGLSPEQQEEVREAMEKQLAGREQSLIGDARRDFVDKFLDMIEPQRRKTLEDEIKTLHGMTDLTRFRTQLVLLLVDAFAGGIAFSKSEKG